MSLFKSTNRVGRLKALDEEYKDALYSFNKEKVRGYLIDWYNQFSYLERMRKKNSEHGTLTDYEALAFGNAVLDCASFVNTHCFAESSSIAAMLLPVEQKISKVIFDKAEIYGYYGTSMSDAISTLARNNQISHIVTIIHECAEALVDKNDF